MNIFKDIKIWTTVYASVLLSSTKDVVYIVRIVGIGDVLWTEPVIRKIAALRKKVIVITKFPQLFENYPLKNVVFKTAREKLPKRTARFLRFIGSKRMFIDLEMAYEKKPAIHFLHAYQQQARLPQTIEYPVLHLTYEEKNKFAYLKPYVVIHIESALKNYRNVYGIAWPLVIEYIQAKGLKVVFISQITPSFPGVLHFETTIRNMISLIYSASFFIGLDSGPSHLAASLNIPSIIFFGSVNPWLRHFPTLFNGIIMQKYCEHAHCYHLTKSTTRGVSCRLVGEEGIPKCALHSSEELIENIEKILAGSTLASNC